MSPKPSMLQPALIGGVALGVASALPGIGFLNCFCCALVLGGAILAVYLYSKDYPSDLPPISNGDGALIGALAGAIGGAVQTVFGLIVSLAFAGAGLGAAQLLEALEQDNVDLPPQVASMMAGSALGVMGALLALPFHVIIGALFGALGGILGVAILGRKAGSGPPPPQVTTPTPPPPPAPPIASGGPSSDPAPPETPTASGGPSSSASESPESPESSDASGSEEREE